MATRGAPISRWTMVFLGGEPSVILNPSSPPGAASTSVPRRAGETSCRCCGWSLSSTPKTWGWGDSRVLVLSLEQGSRVPVLVLGGQQSPGPEAGRTAEYWSWSWGDGRVLVHGEQSPGPRAGGTAESWSWSWGNRVLVLGRRHHSTRQAARGQIKDPGGAHRTSVPPRGPFQRSAPRADDHEPDHSA